MPDFIAAVALGRAEPHALVIAEHRFRYATDFGPAAANAVIDYALVRHVERFPTNEEYEAIAARLDALLSNGALEGNTRCLIDVTHVGKAVWRLFWVARPGGYGLWPYTLTTADKPAVGETAIRDLLAHAGLLFQLDRVRLAGSLPELEAVKRGLVNRRASATVDELEPLTAALVLALYVGRGAGRALYLKATAALAEPLPGVLNQ